MKPGPKGACLHVRTWNPNPASWGLQVLVVVKRVMVDDPKRKLIIRFREWSTKVRIASTPLSLDQSYDNIKTKIILVLDNIKIISFSPYLVHICSRVTSSTTSRVWCGTFRVQSSLRADLAGWLSCTSSVWPWSGAPKVWMYSTFLSGLRHLPPRMKNHHGSMRKKNLISQKNDLLYEC